jgi:hypothetical protein
VDKTLNLSGATRQGEYQLQTKNNSYQKHNRIVSPVVRASDKHEVASSTPVSLSFVFSFKEN